MHRRALLTLLMTTLAAAASAEPADWQRFESGPRRVDLIELYTSEGCNSCPPADRWLTGLDRETGLWRDFVPVALHVDYWDDIGWPDRFADRAYSARQRRYAVEGGARVVYTPGVFRNGEEWRGWRDEAARRQSRPRVGALAVQTDGRQVVARFDAHGEAVVETLSVAVLGMDLATDVSAGENRGRRLLHDFVVLGLIEVPLTATDDGWQARAMLPAIEDAPPRLALAAWVSGEHSQAPLQAVGGYLD